MARRTTQPSPADRAPSSPGGGARAAAPPPFRPVQLATLVDSVPAGSGWVHEMKYDGYRLLIAVGGGEARAYTRSGLDWSERFAPLLAEAAKLKAGSALIDGEAVVLDADGRSSFQSLQNALKSAPDSIDYFAFDLLELDGEDLTNLPLLERKARLATILAKIKKHTKGEEMGRFLLGSTIVMLFEKQAIAFNPEWFPERSVRLGEPMGSASPNNPSG